VGEVPTGLPSFAIPSLEGITDVIPNGFMVSLMCFNSSYAPAKKFAIVDRYDINAGSELTALGAANIVGSLFGAMPVQGGMSRTSLGYASGVKSQVAGLVAAVVAIGVLAMLTPLMYWIPRCALAGIIITAATHLMDFNHAKWLVHHSKKDTAVW
ncbi:sulfate transporter, putative, partial [Perkinsus marinus ATCC 50983]